MTATETHEITLRLNWGPNSTREIEVPTEYRKNGTISGRYELYVDDVHVGWVCKRSDVERRPGTWDAYIAHDQQGAYPKCAEGRGHCVASAAKTRSNAAWYLVCELAEHARTNALAERAEKAYGDDS
jgi:hypothetical protein